MHSWTLDLGVPVRVEDLRDYLEGAFEGTWFPSYRRISIATASAQVYVDLFDRGGPAGEDSATTLQIHASGLHPDSDALAVTVLGAVRERWGGQALAPCTV